MNKHKKLLDGQNAQNRVGKVGTNLLKAKTVIPEFEETMKKIRDFQKQKFGLPTDEQGKSGSISPGPGQYGGIRDW